MRALSRLPSSRGSEIRIALANLYVFSLNNPMRYVDPDGRAVSDISLDGMAQQAAKRSEECAARPSCARVGKAIASGLVTVGAALSAPVRAAVFVAENGHVAGYAVAAVVSGDFDTFSDLVREDYGEFDLNNYNPSGLVSGPRGAGMPHGNSRRSSKPQLLAAL